MVAARAWRIEALTAQQESRLPEWRDQWTEIALCTAPADRDAAERAIAMSYRAASLRPPRVVWCGSPFSLSLTRARMLKLPDWDTESLEHSLRSSVEASVNDSAGPSAGPCVEAFVGSGLGSERRSVGRWVWEALRAATGDSARMRVAEGISGPLDDPIRDAVWSNSTWPPDSERYCLLGQHDAGILSFFDYFRQVCGLGAQTERAQGLDLLARSAGWAAPHANLCWVSDRHHVVRRDDNGLLHCATGPAIAYPDGWGLHFWHGWPVPREWIEHPERVDASIALTWRNIEQRRALTQIIGWRRVIERVPTRVVDMDCDPSIGTLLECDLPDSGARDFCAFSAARVARSFSPFRARATRRAVPTRGHTDWKPTITSRRCEHEDGTPHGRPR